MTKLRSKYNSLSPTTKGTLWFSLSVFFQKGLAIIASPIFTRILSFDEYSMYSLYSTWLSILSVLCTFNLSGGVFHTMMHKADKDYPSLLTTSILFENAMSVIVFCGYLIYYYCVGNLSGITFPVTLLVFANILSNIIFSVWISKSKYINDYLVPSLTTMAQSALSFGLSVGFVFLFSDKVIGRITGIIIPIAISTVVALIILLVKKDLGRPKWTYVKDIFLIAFPLVFHYLAQDILSQSDRLFLNEYATSKEVSIYSLVYSLSLLLTIVIVAFDSTFTPWLYRKFDTKDNSRTGKITMLYFGFLSTLVTMVCLIGPEILLVFGGDKYMDGASLIPILSNTVIALMFYDIYSTVEFYYRKTFIASLVTIAAGGLNIGLNFIFVPKYGMVGAAITTLISYVFMDITHYISATIMMKKRMGGVKYFPDLILMAISLGDMGINLLLLFLYDYRIVRLCLFGALFLTVVILIIVNRKKLLALVQKKEETKPNQPQP
jgi:O-antigen/teichoic acid export membrane protein